MTNRDKPNPCGSPLLLILSTGVGKMVNGLSWLIRSSLLMNIPQCFAQDLSNHWMRFRWGMVHQFHTMVGEIMRRVLLWMKFMVGYHEWELFDSFHCIVWVWCMVNFTHLSDYVTELQFQRGNVFPYPIILFKVFIFCFISNGFITSSLFVLS